MSAPHPEFVGNAALLPEPFEVQIDVAKLAQLGALRGMLKAANMGSNPRRKRVLGALAALGIDVTDTSQIPTLLDEAIHAGQTTQLLSELSILTKDGAEKNKKRIDEILAELSRRGVEPPNELAA